MKAKPKMTVTDAIIYTPFKDYRTDIDYKELTSDYKYADHFEFAWIQLLLYGIENNGVIKMQGIADRVTLPALTIGVTLIQNRLIGVELFQIEGLPDGHYYSLYVNAFLEKRHKRMNAVRNAAHSRWSEGKKEKPKKERKPKKEKVKQATEEPKPVIVKKKTDSDIAVALLREAFADDTLYQTSLEWLNVRKAKRVPNTEGAIQRLIKRIQILSNSNPQVAVAILDKSIRSGWADVFPLNEKTLLMQNTTYQDIYEQLKQKYQQG
jgi:hypothetical protein